MTDPRLQAFFDREKHLALRRAAGCRIYGRDRWKLKANRRLHFVIVDYGSGRYVMRVFVAEKEHAAWVKRSAKYLKRPVQSSGRITFKELRK